MKKHFRIWVSGYHPWLAACGKLMSEGTTDWPMVTCKNCLRRRPKSLPGKAKEKRG